jgi:hypothetical protein
MSWEDGCEICPQWFSKVEKLSKVDVHYQYLRECGNCPGRMIAAAVPQYRIDLFGVGDAHGAVSNSMAAVDGVMLPVSSPSCREVVGLVLYIRSAEGS